MVLQTIELTDRTFKKFSTLIYDHAGIVLGDAKKQLVKSRLAKRLRLLGLSSYEEYYSLLERERFQGEEMVLLLDAISTNKTNFFREISHFHFLAQTALPEIVAKKQSGTINIWSAACSTGEEPYTLGIVLTKFLKNYPQINFKITACDISTKVLHLAEQGVYENTEGLESQMLREYFQKGQNKYEGKVRVKPELRNAVTFQRMNFMDAQWPIRDQFDIIFCRNCMIYFDKPTQSTLVERFHGYLKEGGYFFIGHSESLLDNKHLFNYIQPTVYKR